MIIEELNYGKPSDRQLSLMNAFAPAGTAFNPENYNTVSMVMANNLPTLDKARWNVKALQQMAEYYKGKDFKLDHAPISSPGNNVGFIYDSELVRTPSPPHGYTSYFKEEDDMAIKNDNGYLMLMGYGAVHKSSAMAREIESRRVSDVSVGVFLKNAEYICPICKVNVNDESCPHTIPMDNSLMEKLGYTDEDKQYINSNAMPYYERSAEDIITSELSLVEQGNSPESRIVDSYMLQYFIRNYDYIATNVYRTDIDSTSGLMMV